MARDRLGGFPYEVSKERGLMIIRFYPRPTAKYPDNSVLTLRLDKEDVRKLQEILENSRGLSAQITQKHRNS